MILESLWIVAIIAGFSNSNHSGKLLKTWAALRIKGIVQ